MRSNQYLRTLGVALAALLTWTFAGELHAEEAAEEDFLAQARKAYKKRGNRAQAAQAVELYSKAIEGGGGYDALWEGARATWFYAEFPMGNASRSKRLEILNRGKAWAEKAVKARPNGAEGHFWLGTVMGTWGTARGVLKSLSIHGDVRAEGERARKLNHKVECAGAYRLLGRYYYALPGAFGGDIQRSLKLLQKGVEICPTNDLGRVYLAETLIELDREDEARTQLKTVVEKSRPDPRFAPEFRYVKSRAQKVLDDM